MRRSRWRDPIQPSSFEARLRPIGSLLVFVLLAGALALLRVLLAGAGQALQERLRPLWEALPWALLVLLVGAMAALAALLERRRGR